MELLNAQYNITDISCMYVGKKWDIFIFLCGNDTWENFSNQKQKKYSGSYLQSESKVTLFLLRGDSSKTSMCVKKKVEVDIDFLAR